MKRTIGRIALLLVISMLVGLIAGCDRPTTSSTTVAATTKTAGTTAAGTTSLTTAGTTLIVDKPVTLTYWLEMAGGKVSDVFTNMGDTELYKEMEKRTGVKIVFQHPPTGSAKEQFNLMVGSRQLPGIVEYDWTTYPGGAGKAISDGVIVKLNDLVDKYSPNFKKYMDENPEIKKQSTTDAGEYTNYPFIRGDDLLCINYGPFFRKDWLDELGLPIPQTLDDWYKTLTEFKTKKGATAPFTFDMNRFPDGNLIVGAFGIGSYLYRDGDTIKFGPVEKPYKDFLTLFSKWYSEGLIDKDFAAQDSKSVDAKLTSGKAGAIAGLQNGALGMYLGLMYGKGTSFDLVGVPFPSLKPGEKVLYDRRTWQMNNGSAAITTLNKEPVISAKYLDYGYSPAGRLLFNYGIEGKSFTLKDGKPVFMDKIIKPATGTINNALSNYCRSHWNGPFVQELDQMYQIMGFPQQQGDAIVLWAKAGGFDTRMPVLSPLPEESARLATELNDVTTYFTEHYVKIIMGQESVDTFDTFVSNLKKLGLDDVLKIYNDSLARYIKR